MCYGTETIGSGETEGYFRCLHDDGLSFSPWIEESVPGVNVFAITTLLDTTRIVIPQSDGLIEYLFDGSLIPNFMETANLIGIGTTPGVVRATDMDGDGMSDCILSGAGPGGSVWIQWGCDLSAPGQLIDPNPHYYFDTTDWNNDGLADIVAVNISSTNVLDLYLQGPARTFSKQTLQQGLGGRSVICLDADRDGQSECYVASYAQNVVYKLYPRLSGLISY